jgi:acyl carrier protein
MTAIDRRLFGLMCKIVPLKEIPARDARLTEIGFDSLALVTLFVDLEHEFQLPLDAMRRELHGGCTFGSLEALCGGAST